MDNFEIYGYSVEVLNVFIGPDTKKYLGEEWWKYNRKIYDTEEIAKRAIEENPYYTNGWEGFMEDYKIIPLYKKIEEND